MSYRDDIKEIMDLMDLEHDFSQFGKVTYHKFMNRQILRTEVIQSLDRKEVIELVKLCESENLGMIIKPEQVNSCNRIIIEVWQKI